MRLLHVTDVYRPRLGGIEMFVEELAERQALAGHDVTVLSLATDGAVPGVETTAGGVRIVRAPSRAPWPMPFLPAGDGVDLTSFDRVHAHLSVVSPFSTRVTQAASRRGVPVILTVHSMWDGREGWVRTVGLIAGWARWPATWTAVSSAAAATMREVLGHDTPVLVVPNGVEVDWWRDSGPLTGPVDDASRPVTVVSVMRLAGRKRPLQLLDAMAEARLAVPRDVALRLLVIGTGPLEERLRERVRALGIGDWVELAGARTRAEIREAYRHADVYAAPCLQESFGLAALEARATGLPVVAMTHGGVGEFVRDGVEGLLCEDDDALARDLARLVGDHALRRSLTEHNRRHAPTHDWARTLAGFEDAYAHAGAGVARSRTSPASRLS
ncbi:glycosyltransferase [Nocardioides korecus]